MKYVYFVYNIITNQFRIYANYKDAKEYCKRREGYCYAKRVKLR